MLIANSIRARSRPAYRVPPWSVVFAGLMTLGAHATAETDALISACADGNMAICDQLDRAPRDEHPTGPLNRHAKAFADRAPDLGIEHDKVPDLAKAYPLVVRDYFTAPSISPENKALHFKEQVLEDCAEHYAQVWQQERNWWPTDAAGRPDWRLIYPHIMDHYFGYCLH